MAKVSIGLRGWRFEESAVFDEAGRFRPFREMPEDERTRLSRLATLLDKPCDACWLRHGDENIERCNPPEAVYGEPMAEVLVCGEHEPDFYYWYFEAGGEEARGTEAFQERFHEWFAGGGRAPEDYEGLEHVDTSPADVPVPDMPDDEDLAVDPPEEERVRIDLREGEVYEGAEATREEAAAAEEDDDLELDDVDLDTEYPGA
jgi:hypothetical protein